MSDTTSSSGIGFFGLLTVLFIGLKLTSIINWSWWWVLLPEYGPIGLALCVLLLGAIVMGLGDG